MAEKKSFALRVDAEMMKTIEKWASDEFRSVNGQIEWMLHQMLKEAGRLGKESQEAEKKSQESSIKSREEKDKK